MPWGDTEYDFWCSVCGGGFEVYQPYSKVVLAVLRAVPVVSTHHAFACRPGLRCARLPCAS